METRVAFCLLQTEAAMLLPYIFSAHGKINLPVKKSLAASLSPNLEGSFAQFAKHQEK